MVAAKSLQPNSKKESIRGQISDLLLPTTRKKPIIPFNLGFFDFLAGDYKAALLFNQILYWADRTSDPEGWFYKTYAEWKEETGLSRYQVTRILYGDARIAAPQRTLKSIGIETIVKKARFTGNPTVHYRINREILFSALEEYRQQFASMSAQAEQPAALAVMQHPDISIDHSAALQTATVQQIEIPQSSTSFDPEITTEKESSEHQSKIISHPPPDDDSDFQIFSKYMKRFGKLKNQSPALLRAELKRLGVEQVGQVLERCATRGRSWNYVLRALENETAAETPKQDWVAFNAMHEQTQPEIGAEPELPEVVVEPKSPATERVKTSWDHLGNPNSTVADAWSAALHQMQMQFGGEDFLVNKTTLVDFEPENATFTVVVPSANIRDQLQQRYYRLVRRIMSDIFGSAAEVYFVTKDDWSLPEDVTQAGG